MRPMQAPTRCRSLASLLLLPRTGCILFLALSGLFQLLPLVSCEYVEVGADGDVVAASEIATGDDGDDEACVDGNDSCPGWSERGECEANPGYMLVHCRRSCRMCGPLDMGTEQEIAGKNSDKVREIVLRAEQYIRTEVLVKPEYESVRSTCRNQNKLCAFWASIGECEANPAWMKIQCAPVCGTCERIDIKNRCPRDLESEVDAMGPGDLDALFLRITNSSDPEYSRYKPTILSRPSHPEGANPEDATYKIGPWVVTFEDFTTAEECERLIHLGGVEGYERSTDVGKEKFDGTYDKKESSGRTSTNAWCQNECYEDPLAKQVVQRIESLTGIPEKNSEHLQLLKYEVSQRYVVHHDYIPHHVDRAQGPRVLTLFLYLNDVEAGGGTNFPQLDLTVMPKRGKALLWPSVLNEDPNKKDGRTTHQALPVEGGVKYGANAWLHLRDFKTPNEDGCN